MSERKGRRERYAEQTREAILQAAETLFAQKSFAGARIDEIAEVAECSKSSLFLHFTDKESLYRAVIKRIRQQLNRAVTQVLEAELRDQREEPLTLAQVQAVLVAFVRWYVTFSVEHMTITRLQLWEAASGWPVFRSIPLEKQEMESIVRFLTFLEHAQQAGLIQSTLDPLSLLFMISDLCLMHVVSLPRVQAAGDTLLRQRQMDGNAPPLEETLVHRLITFILHGSLAM